MGGLLNLCNFSNLLIVLSLVNHFKNCVFIFSIFHLFHVFIFSFFCSFLHPLIFFCNFFVNLCVDIFAFFYHVCDFFANGVRGFGPT